MSLQIIACAATFFTAILALALELAAGRRRRRAAELARARRPR